MLRFSVLADRFRDRLITLRGNEKLALDRIERLLNGPLPEDVVFSLEVAADVLRLSPPTDEGSIAFAHTVRPELLTSELRLDAAKLRERQARLDYYPDFTLSLDYTVIGEANELPNGTRPSDSCKNAAMVYFAINLPFWWDKQDAQVKQAKEKARAQINPDGGIRFIGGC